METLYGEVANRILGLIEQGTYKEGDKIPSLRALSQQFDVSINTIKEAYLLLESQRFLEAKPQSGYYVRRKVPPLPRASLKLPSYLTMNPKEVSICRIYGEIIKRNMDNSGASLAIALPDSKLLPVRKLNQAFQNSWRNSEVDTSEYLVSPGLESLRKQIAQHSLESGLSISPDDIIITSGASEALTLTILTLCKPGDIIAVETPTYFNFLHFLETLEIKVLEIPTNSIEGMNLEVLAWALNKYPVKAVLAIPNFNNPLGFQMPEEKKKLLVNLLEQKKIPLIEDDVYGELTFMGKRPSVCKSYDKTGNVILVSSFSKTLASGYRVGWIIPGKYYLAVDRLKSLATVSTATPTQIAISAYLAQGQYDRHLRSLRQHLADQTGAMAEQVADSFPEGTKVSRPSGGFVLWVELPEDFDTMDLYQKALQDGIVFSPGATFSASGDFKNCLRLNAGMWNENTRRAVQRLGFLASEQLRFNTQAG